MSKPTRTARQIQALLQERIDATPELRGRVTDIQPGEIIWIDTGPEGGANWTVRRVAHQDSYRSDVAKIIRDIQREFDLDTE